VSTGDLEQKKRATAANKKKKKAPSIWFCLSLFLCERSVLHLVAHMQKKKEHDELINKRTYEHTKKKGDIISQ
jgi:hypothetical protein